MNNGASPHSDVPRSCSFVAAQQPIRELRVQKRSPWVSGGGQFGEGLEYLDVVGVG